MNHWELGTVYHCFYLIHVPVIPILVDNTLIFLVRPAGSRWVLWSYGYIPTFAVLNPLVPVYTQYWTNLRFISGVPLTKWDVGLSKTGVYTDIPRI